MKTLHAVLFLALLGVSLAGKFTEDMLLPIDYECMKETGVEVQAVLENVDDDFLSKEGNPKMNEFYECWYRKMNAIDENNEIKLDVIKTIFAAYVEVINNKIVDKDQASNDAVEACKNVEGCCLGDRLIKLGNCVTTYVKNN